MVTHRCRLCWCCSNVSPGDTCSVVPQAVIRHHLGVEDVNFDLASKIKVGRLCEAFPVLAPSIVENAFLAFRHNFRDCAAALDVAFPGTRALDEEVLVFAYLFHRGSVRVFLAALWLIAVTCFYPRPPPHPTWAGTGAPC